MAVVCVSFFEHLYIVLVNANFNNGTRLCALQYNYDITGHLHSAIHNTSIEESTRISKYRVCSVFGPKFNPYE